jgi:hypothetical protein
MSKKLDSEKWRQRGEALRRDEAVYPGDSESVRLARLKLGYPNLFGSVGTLGPTRQHNIGPRPYDLRRHRIGPKRSAEELSELMKKNRSHRRGPHR